MEELSRLRRWSALATLALGGFAIGLTEFVVMGLLPEMAQDLRPAEYARSTSLAEGQAGWLISAYALGVVVGAPTIAALTARVARKRLVVILLALFVAGTAASALAPTFGLVLVARFVAALPHGAYFGAAGLLASRLIGPNSHGKGFAVVITGLTVANVVGVPLITALGQATNWRVAYAAVALVFAVTLIAAVLLVPSVAETLDGSARTELAVFRSRQVWLVAATAAVGFAGFMAIYTYAAPVTTRVAGLSPGAVPWVLVVAGLGMTVGNLLGGTAADRNLPRSAVGGFVAVLVAGVLFCLTAHSAVGLFVGIFLVGATSMFLSPALQARLIQAAPRAQLMGAAINQSATNVANSVGAGLGGLAIAHGLGYRSPAVIGAALAAVGLVLTLLSFRQQRTRSAEHPTDVQPVSAHL
jgi:DHA1 family inner membrane transport protein